MRKSRITLLLQVGGLVAMMVGYASAATVTFREGGGSGYIGLPWDVVSINPPSDEVGPDWTSEAVRVSANPCPPTQGAAKFYVLLAVKDLMTILPITSSQISSATLTLVGNSGDNDTVVAYRITISRWLLHVPGVNEMYASGKFADDKKGSPWTGNDGFSASDYTSSNAATGAWGTAYQQPLELDVTDQLKAMYAEAPGGTNCGWAVTNYDASDQDITIYNPGGSSSAYYPSLEVVYTSTGTNTLTVNKGSGGGSYAAGTAVTVTADPVPSGAVFGGWFGDSIWLWDDTAPKHYLADAAVRRHDHCHRRDARGMESCIRDYPYGLRLRRLC